VKNQKHHAFDRVTESCHTIDRMNRTKAWPVRLSAARTCRTFTGNSEGHAAAMEHRSMRSLNFAI
jgi:hypothetical protein